MIQKSFMKIRERKIVIQQTLDTVHTCSNLINNNRVDICYSYCDIENRFLYSV